MYQNSYSVVNTKGKIITGTHKRTFALVAKTETRASEVCH